MKVRKFLHSGAVQSPTGGHPWVVPESLLLALESPLYKTIQESIEFYKRQGYSLEEAEKLANTSKETPQLKQASLVKNPYVISSEKKQRLEKLADNKKRLADVMTFGMTPVKNEAALMAGAEDLTRNIAGTLALEGLNLGILLPVLRAIGHTNLGRSLALSYLLHKTPTLFYYNLTPKGYMTNSTSPLFTRFSTKHVLNGEGDNMLFYGGPRHSVNEILNADGSVNMNKLVQIIDLNADYWGGNRLAARAENPVWHRADPTTLHHTLGVIRSASSMPVPQGYTRAQASLAAALHDAGKIFTGDGHALVGANYFKQVFPDMDLEVYNAIALHMDTNPTSPLALFVQIADIDNGLHLARISEAERFGLPKVDRNNLSLTQLQALEDLAQFRRSGLYRQVFRVTPDWEDFGWNLSPDNPTFMQLFAKDRMTMQEPWARVGLQTPTGRGVVGWNPKRNMSVYTSKSFPKVEGLKYVPGEANMMLDGTNGYKFILTSPKTDILDFMTDLLHSTDPNDITLYNSLNPQLTNTIGKNVMKDFWINARKALKPGTYMSGDNGGLPLGSDLINAFKKRQLHKVSILEPPLMQKSISRSGLSPDSYSSIIRLGNRDGSLRWGEGFGTWNNSAVENKYIYEAYLKLMNGEITPDLYAEIFNPWAEKMGGRPVEWLMKEGKWYPIHPHPYIFAKKKGGKICN